jgi:Leucine-rich repeat (LRR) protein
MAEVVFLDELTTGLDPAMTLGCGGYGGNITSDNISPMHLLNIKRLAYEISPAQTQPTTALAPAARVTNPDQALPRAEVRPAPKGIAASSLSARIDQFLSSRGFVGGPSPSAKRAASGPDPAVPERPADFVCEEDVRQAVKATLAENKYRKAKGLAELQANKNEIADVKALKDLPILQSLHLANNQITDISPLGTLAKLQYLELTGNKVSDLKPFRADTVGRGNRHDAFSPTPDRVSTSWVERSCRDPGHQCCAREIECPRRRPGVRRDDRERWSLTE